MARLLPGFFPGKQPLRLNYFDAVLAQRARIRCDIEFQTGGCHYANIPSLFPAGRPFIASSEQGLLLPYLTR